MMAIGSWFRQLWRTVLLKHERQERKLFRRRGTKANDPPYPGLGRFYEKGCVFVRHFRDRADKSKEALH